MFKTGFRICDLCDGLRPVLGSGFEHLYLITFSKLGSDLVVFLMVWNRFWDGVLGIRIELCVHNED